jgi:hypothetical protein
MPIIAGTTDQSQRCYRGKNPSNYSHGRNLLTARHQKAKTFQDVANLVPSSKEVLHPLDV